MRGEDQPRPDVRRLERAVETPEDRLEAPAAAVQRRGTLVVELARGRAHLLIEPVEQQPPGVAVEHAQRLVQPAAVQVRVEVAEAR